MKTLFAIFAFCVFTTSCADAAQNNTTPLQALKKFEGTVLVDGKCVTYDDATSKPCTRKADGTWDCKGTPTIGYGETSKAIVDKGSISVKEAEELLQKRIKEFEDVVATTITVPLTNGQKTALVCFAYNVGKNAFKTSTLVKLLNEGKYDEVPAQLRRWVYSGGKVSKGLKNRREAEIKIWNEK